MEVEALTALVRMIPYSRPYLMLGRVTFQKTCQSEAPMVRAASSSARSMVSSIGMSSRTTKGMVTKRVASAIPVPHKDKRLAFSKAITESSSREGDKAREGKCLHHVIHFH